MDSKRLDALSDEDPCLTIIMLGPRSDNNMLWSWICRERDVERSVGIALGSQKGMTELHDNDSAKKNVPNFPASHLRYLSIQPNPQMAG